MTVDIKNGLQIKAFQADFTTALPALKPVFFHNAPEETEGTWSGYVVLKTDWPLAMLSDALPAHKECVVCDETTTAARFESEMYQKYGLFVRVFKYYLGDWMALSAAERQETLVANSHKAVAALRPVEDVIL